MSYWPAIIEWGFWLLPYALIALVAWAAWPRVIGLRGEEIRSLCVFSMVFVLGFSLRRFDQARDPWEDHMWLLAVISMITIALISWGAERAKLKFAQYELDIGRKASTDPALKREQQAAWEAGDEGELQ